MDLHSPSINKIARGTFENFTSIFFYFTLQKMKKIQSYHACYSSVNATFSMQETMFK